MTDRYQALRGGESRFECEVDGFMVSTDRSRFDLEMIHGWLRDHSYWARGIPREVVERAIANSLPFGLFAADRQIGFARVITDFATYGYLSDVFVLESHRGQGGSKALMAAVMAHPELGELRRWGLVTADAQELYRKFGFVGIEEPGRYMEIVRKDIYLTTKGETEP